MCKPEPEGEDKLSYDDAGTLRVTPVIIVNLCQEEPLAVQEPTGDVGTRHLLCPPQTIKLENPWQITNETPFGFGNK